jgi:hypothetical protein
MIDKLISMGYYMENVHEGGGGQAGVSNYFLF